MPNRFFSQPNESAQKEGVKEANAILAKAMKDYLEKNKPQ